MDSHCVASGKTENASTMRLQFIILNRRDSLNSTMSPKGRSSTHLRFSGLLGYVMPTLLLLIALLPNSGKFKLSSMYSLIKISRNITIDVADHNINFGQ